MSTINKPALSDRDRIAKECGKLIMWYLPLILIGVFIGWLWAFLALTVLYLLTLVDIWSAIEMIKESTHAND